MKIMRMSVNSAGKEFDLDSKVLGLNPVFTTSLFLKARAHFKVLSPKSSNRR